METPVRNASLKIGTTTASEVGGRVQIRPVGGGTEWDAMPDNVVALSAREELSARLAIKNGNSRDGL
ncbi:hypothetical protein [Streptomyces thermocarboxydovorans]|uniref:hypothetical protein n=1 Tax=Streptomyces thermocarboxydovorans TaxID=59298 RepID=UPI0031D1335E